MPVLSIPWYIGRAEVSRLPLTTAAAAGILSATPGPTAATASYLKLGLTVPLFQLFERVAADLGVVCVGWVQFPRRGPQVVVRFIGIKMRVTGRTYSSGPPIGARKATSATMRRIKESVVKTSACWHCTVVVMLAADLKKTEGSIRSFFRKISMDGAVWTRRDLEKCGKVLLPRSVEKTRTKVEEKKFFFWCNYAWKLNGAPQRNGQLGLAVFARALLHGDGGWS